MSIEKLSRAQITGMNFHYKHYSFPYFLDAMMRYGFQNIELWGASPHFYVDELSSSDIRGIRREIDHRGLSVVCFTPEQCVYPINLAAKEVSIRKRSIDYFLKSAEAASILGAPKLLVTTGWGYENESREEAWKRSRDSLEKLVRRAEELGLGVVLEPLTRNESNLVNNLGSLKRMLDEIQSPKLAAMVDTIPMALAGENFTDYIDQLGDDFVHSHFIDGPDGHLAWGDGNLPLDQYIEQLVRGNYAGSLTLEFTSFQYVKDPDLAIEKTLDRLSPFLA